MYRIFHGKHRIYLSNDEADIAKYNPDFIFKKPKEEQIKEALKVSKKATKPLKILLLGNPDKILKKVVSEFNYQIAAGGIVENKQGKILLMKRLGKWDLPKGKLDKGETIEECALREIEEETGASELSVESSFAETYHTYYRNEKWIIKHTHWYIVACADSSKLSPQFEEDIEQVAWVDFDTIDVLKIDTYPAIQKLLKLYKKRLLKKSKKV
ncbi:MAG: NUDIX hydrolase [Bacteroidetes bacterium]|nr:MAG: NUDIX hydrolase [Bacteroidota bacterium]